MVSVSHIEIGELIFVWLGMHERHTPIVYSFRANLETCLRKILTHFLLSLKKFWVDWSATHRIPLTSYYRRNLETCGNFLRLFFSENLLLYNIKNSKVRFVNKFETLKKIFKTK